ncbi:MAG: hypothetical protein KDB86_11730 [Actinobacteria bacterium]|nr:hypothetical protein [Actinomycetota bacterium]MCB9389305.1 hypothetical protein [Acidimicrobiia bacterium]
MRKRIAGLVSAAALSAAPLFAFAPGVAGAIPTDCSLAGLVSTSPDVPAAFTGPTTVKVGETNTYTVEVDMAPLLDDPAVKDFEGTATAVTMGFTLSDGVEVGASSLSGPGNPTLSVSGTSGTISIPGPISFPPLPKYTGTIEITATTPGTKVVTFGSAKATANVTAPLAVQGATLNCSPSGDATLISVTAEGDGEATATTAAADEEDTSTTTKAADDTSSTTKAADDTSSTTAASTTATTAKAAATTGTTTTGSSTTSQMANTGANSGPMSLAGLALILAGSGALFAVLRNRFVDAEQ